MAKFSLTEKQQEGLWGMAQQTYTALLNSHLAKKQANHNYLLNERAADNADARQRAQFNDLYSPQAQMQQFEAAGLSKSALAAQISGGGSAGGSQGAGAAGMAAPQVSPAFTALDMANMELIHANADKAREEAETLRANRNPDVENTLAEVRLKNAQTATEEQKAKLVQQQAKVAKIEEKIKYYESSMKETENEYFRLMQIQKIAKGVQEIRQMTANAENAEVEVRFNKDTYETRKQYVKEQVVNLIKDTALKESQIKLNNAEIETALNAITQRYMELGIQNANQQAQEKFWEDTIENVRQELKLDKKRFTKEVVLGSIKSLCEVIEAGTSIAGMTM